MHTHTIRVLLCDDHRIVREGLKQVLADPANGPPEIKVVAEAVNGPDVLTQLPPFLTPPIHQPTNQPTASPGGNLHLVLLDIALPGHDGLDVLQGVCRWTPAATQPATDYEVDQRISW